MSVLGTMLYVFLSHVSPEFLFPGLAEYRPLVWLAVVLAIASFLIVLKHQYPAGAPQNLLLTGLFFVILFSSAVEAGSAGLASAFTTFLPSFAAFFFCAATLRSPKHIRFMALSLILPSLFMAVAGVMAYRSGGVSAFIFMWPPVERQSPGEMVSRRVRGLGFLNDPNDFAQLLLIVLPLVWLFWKERAAIRNLILVIAPTCVILVSLLLTKSRGGILGFGAILLLAIRRRFGTVISAVLTAMFLVGVMGSGILQRGEVSVHEDSAAGRVEAWGNGVSMWKSSPLWGIGYGRFGDNNEDQSGLTAHNSYVLCFAELGTIGYLLWLALIISTLLDLNSLLKRSFLDEEIDPGVVRAANAIRFALIGYLTTAWFLSRTYIVTLYVVLGMAVAVVWMAHNETQQEVRTSTGRIALWTARAVLASVVLVYGTLRMRAI